MTSWPEGCLLDPFLFPVGIRQWSNELHVKLSIRGEEKTMFSGKKKKKKLQVIAK